MMARHTSHTKSEVENHLSIALLEGYLANLLEDGEGGQSVYAYAADGVENIQQEYKQQYATFTSPTSNNHKYFIELKLVLRFTLSGLRQEKGVYTDITGAWGSSLHSDDAYSTYTQVTEWRKQWAVQRRRYQHQQHKETNEEVARSSASSGGIGGDVRQWYRHYRASPPPVPANHQNGSAVCALQQSLPLFTATMDTINAHASTAARSSAAAAASPNVLHPPPQPRMHFVTFASDATRPGLQNLLMSAAIAGVHVEVIIFSSCIPLSA